MFIKFYGTRGSIPISDKNFTDFGGNTTCVLISGLDEGMESIIMDAGTGIRKLGKEILSGEIDVGDRINLGFTHFHLDHIQGFPFFDPAYNSTSRMRIATMGKKNIHNLKDIFSAQMQSIYFPVQLDRMGRMGAKMEFIKYDTYELTVETGARVNVIDVNHPGGCIAVRIQFSSTSVAFCTDVEHPGSIDEKVVKLASNVDVLIHDAEYTDEELKIHKGWGHSSYSQAIEVAERANVKNLILTHHDPDHDDSFLKKMEKKCQERYKNLILARDGYELRV
jgi:phosphoribosyl 1,2-cyclic phosphodiesterase